MHLHENKKEYTMSTILDKKVSLIIPILIVTYIHKLNVIINETDFHTKSIYKQLKYFNL